MNKGINFGLDLKIPFFKNAFILVIKTTDAQADDIIEKFEGLKSLILSIAPDSEKIFSMIVCKRRF